MTAKKTQIEKFKKAARELECDEDEVAFEDKLHRIAQAPPSAAKPKKEETPDK